MSGSPKPGGSSSSAKSVARSINEAQGSLDTLTPKQRSVLRNRPREVLQFVAPPWRERVGDRLNVRRLPDFVPPDSAF